MTKKKEFKEVTTCANLQSTKTPTKELFEKEPKTKSERETIILLVGFTAGLTLLLILKGIFKTWGVC